MKEQFFTVYPEKPKGKRVYAALNARGVALGLSVVMCVTAALVDFGTDHATAVTQVSTTANADSVTVLTTPAATATGYTAGQVVPMADTADLVILAKTLWGEARGVQSAQQQAAVVWCILNRVDDPRWPDTIAQVCDPSQFHGYDPDNPVQEDLYALAADVWHRWQLEKAGQQDVGRVLPKEYVFFHGDGTNNHFRKQFISNGDVWGWILPNPYYN